MRSPSLAPSKRVPEYRFRKDRYSCGIGNALQETGAAHSVMPWTLKNQAKIIDQTRRPPGAVEMPIDGAGRPAENMVSGV